MTEFKQIVLFTTNIALFDFFIFSGHPPRGVLNSKFIAKRFDEVPRKFKVKQSQC